jgi:hypothetical protein
MGHFQKDLRSREFDAAKLRCPIFTKITDVPTGSPGGRSGNLNVPTGKIGLLIWPIFGGNSGWKRPLGGIHMLSFSLYLLMVQTFTSDRGCIFEQTSFKTH